MKPGLNHCHPRTVLGPAPGWTVPDGHCVVCGVCKQILVCSPVCVSDFVCTLSGVPAIKACWLSKPDAPGAPLPQAGSPGWGA